MFGVYYIQVLNEANLTNAILSRTVLTRSDLGGAIIEGADFSDAVLDLPQKLVRPLIASIANQILLFELSHYRVMVELHIIYFNVVKTLSWHKTD